MHNALETTIGTFAVAVGGPIGGRLRFFDSYFQANDYRNAEIAEFAETHREALRVLCDLCVS